MDLCLFFSTLQWQRSGLDAGFPMPSPDVVFDGMEKGLELSKATAVAGKCLAFDFCTGPSLSHVEAASGYCKLLTVLGKKVIKGAFPLPPRYEGWVFTVKSCSSRKGSGWKGSPMCREPFSHCACRPLSSLWSGDSPSKAFSSSSWLIPLHPYHTVFQLECLCCRGAHSPHLSSFPGGKVPLHPELRATSL